MHNKEVVVEITKSRVGRKRLSMDIPLDINEKIVRGARKRNITITKFVLQALMEKIRAEQYYE